MKYGTSVATSTQFLDQFRSRLISQLIKGISKIYQTSLRYFNGAIILTFFLSSLASYFFFNLNKSVIELATVKSVTTLLSSKAGSSLQCCHSYLNFLNNCHCIWLFNYTLALLHQYHKHNLLPNGAQFLKIAFLCPSFWSTSWAALFATVVVPLASIYNP